MNFLGYLITWANLQNFEGSRAVNDLSIKVADVKSLAQQVKSYSQFSLEDFKGTGYSRHGTVGKYLSKNLRDFMFHGIGDAKDDGIILTLNFKSEVSGLKRDPLSFFIHRGDHDEEDIKKFYEYFEKSKDHGGT